MNSLLLHAVTGGQSRLNIKHGLPESISVRSVIRLEMQWHGRAIKNGSGLGQAYTRSVRAKKKNNKNKK